MKKSKGSPNSQERQQEQPRVKFLSNPKSFIFYKSQLEKINKTVKQSMKKWQGKKETKS